MKLAIASDLHLEFGTLSLLNDEKAEVLILSGDIVVADDLHRYPHSSNDALKSKVQKRADSYREFFEECSKNFAYTVYIAGNHEFYHGKFNSSLQDLKNLCDNFTNVYFMENNSIKIKDVTFIGCTLWTDMNNEDPLTLVSIANRMNDYRIVTNDNNGYSKLRPIHTVIRHKKSLEYITSVIEGKFEEKFVVVGHMAPSKLSIHPRYTDDTIMNGAYASNLDQFILDHPQIKLWTHGHTHHEFDYMIGTTRIVCNPRGYIGYEQQALDFKLKYLDI